MIKAEILKRITYAKFIMIQGHESLKSSTPIADGLAVSLYQDSAEMLLRSIAEHFNADVDKFVNFDKLFNQIEKAPNNADKVKLTSKIAISQLNKSRVNFKHYGLLPTHEDAVKFSHDIEIFFQRSIEECLNLSYEDISLADVVKDNAIKNHLKKAESFFYNEEYAESILESKKAFYLSLQKTSSQREIISFNIPNNIDNRQLTNFFAQIENHIINQDNQLNIIKFGINLADYIHFRNITPAIGMTADGTFHVEHLGREDNSKDAAKFCSNFAILSAIEIEKKQYIIR